MVGATRESVNRALRRLAQQGVLARHGQRYVMLSDSQEGQVAP
jgi:DNA-binding GntR family transcriptional regulator